MLNATVTLIASDRLEQATSRWWQPIAEAWTMHGETPSVQALSMSEAVEQPGVVVGSSVLLVITGQSSTSDLAKLVDRLSARLLPLVILAPAHPRYEAFRDDGVIVETHDAHPEAIASMLYAGVARQPVIESIRNELRALRRAQAGLTDHIDRMHSELQLAAIIQQDFLPSSLPVVDGLDFSVLYRPCGYVSGDIYDVVRLDENRIGFFVADATGHGVPAALMTMVLSRALHTTDIDDQGRTRVVPPGEAIARLNGAIVRQAASTHRFATGMYGIIDRSTNVAKIAVAGHPPPLLVRADGTARTVDGGGPMLGVFPEAEYEEIEVELRDDEMLIVYSDGFETTFPDAGANQHERRLPTQRYIERFSSLGGRSMSIGIGQALDDLAVEIDTQSGSLHQLDDLTALVVGGRDYAGVRDALDLGAEPEPEFRSKAA
ncbi:MAG: serine/threonine-protein phosphatase [Phycisphaeraceae bacterium]|nr:serine/threonine-protein phosphatase [Phycisphaeraceae bacterium]